MTEAPEVLVRKEGRLGRLTLNRAGALHALNTNMCRLMIDALVAWRDDPAVSVVLVDHVEGTRGFCAGGDIRMLAESGAKDGVEAREFFFTEYRLNHLIHEYPKPYVALIDGVTMGGGVGISVHGDFRVATERTTFAMPETGIGLFPDVGGGWFLPRLPEPEFGTWLALTGARLKGEECVTAGVATHLVPSELLGAARAQIAGAADTHDPKNAIRSGLDALCEAKRKPIVPAPGALKPLFGFDAVEEIFAALARDSANPWCVLQLETLKTKSPQTLKVALRQIREGAKCATFADNMRMEYRIGARVVGRHDFLEGVRAVIVDKDNAPIWNPATLEGVTDTMLDEIFAPLPASEEWSPL
ncbi:MAG: enoyl-CoA hydratase/isomerase family protein [Hyphomonadaceae bacterium]|nr:enoyl-CoA hydratase/isomerase family protein [Hyphomonadaceae bacterium]